MSFRTLTSVRLLGTLAIAATLSGFSSCTRSMKSVCEREVSVFSAQVASASERIGPPRGKEINRALASELSLEVNRREWKDWAEVRIRELRDFMEYAEDSGIPISDLQLAHRLSNELVVLWGHADTGRTEGLRKSLAFVRSHTQELQDKFCRSPKS